MRFRRSDGPGRPANVFVVIGPAGVGKSTIAEALAQQLGWESADADALHSEDAVHKMAAGEPLTEADRAPWLDRVSDLVDDAIARGGSLVIACSALRRSYRDRLRRPQVEFIELRVPESELAARLEGREGHFAGPELLASQLALLEPLAPHERGLAVDGAGTPDEVVERILVALMLDG